jgi:hypothetical protein
VKKIFLCCIVFLVLLPVFASAEIIPADRLIDWKPGVPGGIPYRTTICANVRNAPYNAYGNGVHDDTSAINAAIAACPEGQVVLIPAGTYRISGNILIRKGITVRGEGPSKTKILQYSNDDIFSISGEGKADFVVDVLSGYTKGSYTVGVSSASGFNVGEVVVLDQLNDPELVTPTGEGTCTWCGRWGTEGTRAYGQIFIVQSISGNQITFNRPLYYTYRSQFKPMLVKYSAYPVVKAGIEDLYVESPSGYSDSNAFIMEYCLHSWLRNVESYNMGKKHVIIRYGAYGNEVRDSYFHDVKYFTSDRGYGFFVFGQATDNLIENNIIYYMHAGLVLESSGPGNVIAYNYIQKTNHHQTDWWQPGVNSHGAHPYMNLWEGNVLGGIHFDNYWGSGSHNLVLRNYLTMKNPDIPVSANIVGVTIDESLYYMSFVGNVLGRPGCAGPVEQLPYKDIYNNPVIWKIGFMCCAETGYPTDPKVNQTLIRHGNWECPTNAVQWNPSIADHNIPNSFYLSSKPAFFGSLPWPAIGSDLNPMNGTIPAKQRFDAIVSGGVVPPPPVAIPGDLNGDSKVDISDLVIVATNFGRTSGFDARANVVSSSPEVIDISDLSFVARRFTG